MKAVVLQKYGGPEGLILSENPKPAVKPGEILIQVYSSSVTAGDCELRRLELPLGLSFFMRLYSGWKTPKHLQVLGQEFSGVICELGEGVHDFSIGDEVFGTTGMKFGAYGQYLALPAIPRDAEGVVVKKPENLSFEEAAVLPTAGMEAMHYLQSSQLTKGQKVLIIGAGGSIGTCALQIAKNLGAEVTVVDSGDKLEMLSKLGADEVIDFTATDYLKTKNRYHVILDVVGKKDVARRMRLLESGGSYALAFPQISDLFLSLGQRIFKKKHLRIQASNQSKGELEYIKDVVENGDVKPVLDRIFPIESAAEAHAYAESGRKIGNIALSFTEKLST
jgi:NADPH:quinone reductase-like Zn-dependent oxidoreductase